jgi:formylglycine-generating enzyme required for sulfatase activity
VLGTPAYMAPEQAQRKNVGPRCDLFSLGCVLYRMTTGELPFQGADMVSTLIAVATEEPRPPRELTAEVPAALSELILSLLAKEPEERPPSAHAVADVLEGIAREQASRVAAFEPGVEGGAMLSRHELQVQSPAGSGRESMPPRPPVGKPSSKRKWLIGGGVAAGVLLLGLLGLWAGGVIRLKTPEGTLVVEVDVPNPDVYVDGGKMTVRWDKDGKQAEIAVKPGTHQVEVKKNGFTAAGQTVTLSDGGRKVLTASLKALAKADLPKAPASDPPKATGVRPQPLDCTSPNGVSADVVRRAQEAWAKYLGRDVETNLEIHNGVTMTFVLVPPGKFRMGSPFDENGRYENETLHMVTLTEPFDLGKYEVTQTQYKALTGKTPSLFRGSDRPVEQVTWNEAEAFGRALTNKRSDKHVYRLPTEAEWEYSCRGGRPLSEPFGIGDNRSLTSRDANFNNDFRETRKVGSYVANALGLYDMHGNVWEWCADWNEPYPLEAVTNPLRTTGGPFRVARGGCWNEPTRGCRSALRQGSPEARRDGYMGFRLARSVP